MFKHSIDLSAIAPFFVVMALAMVVVRVGTLSVRAATLPALPVRQPTAA